MARPSIILFDAVGTVIQPVPRPSRVYHLVGRRFGCELDHDEVARRFHSAFHQVFSSEMNDAADSRSEREQWKQVVARVFAEMSTTAEIFENLWDHFADPGNWQVYEDVAPCWQELWNRKIPVGLASNFDDRLLKICERPPFDMLQHIFYSGEIGFRKPDPRFYDSIQQQLSLRGREILMIGDNVENDLTAPRRHGWQAMRIDRSGTGDGESIVQSLLEVPAHI